jgi:predicted amidohydrolase YtcJ
LEELIIGYTRDAAYAEFMENEKGQIKEGYLADMVLFSHDLFCCHDPKVTISLRSQAGDCLTMPCNTCTAKVQV